MTPIKIPDTCKPGLDITLGYSGGMALYVANWASLNRLFKIVINKLIIQDTTFYRLHVSYPIKLN